MEVNANAREPLITLARYLQAASNTNDGWGDGLLGAIGLKKETITNKYELNTLSYRSAAFFKLKNILFQTKNINEVLGMCRIFIVFEKVSSHCFSHYCKRL